MGDRSVVQFYQSPVRYLKELVGRESVFEKPYVDENYRKMHFDPPTPDWPVMPPIDPWPPLSPIEGPVPGLTLCGITCYESLSDCEEPIWCHQSIWCGHDPQCRLCTWTVEGATIGYTWRRIVGGAPDTFWGINIWIDGNLLVEGKALIHVQMTDPCGNLCGEDLEVVCKVCPPDTVISWDTVAETIGLNAELAIAVKDGLGPYRWSVAGTDFSLAHAITEGVSNTLISGGSACGTATITVTDYCDDVATGYVRSTAGEWCEITFDSCIITGAITEGDGATRIQGKYKLVENWSNACTGSGFGCSMPTWGACIYSYSYCHCLTSGCHGTMGCTQCLDHGGICAAGYPVPCFSPADCLCCVETGNACSDNVPYSAMCSLDTSKLYEWKCSC